MTIRKAAPMTRRLYHYTPWFFALETLQRRRLKIARLQELNDPFELRSHYLPAELRSASSVS